MLSQKLNDKQIHYQFARLHIKLRNEKNLENILQKPNLVDEIIIST